MLEAIQLVIIISLTGVLICVIALWVTAKTKTTQALNSKIELEHQLATNADKIKNSEEAINDLKTEIETQKAFSAEQQQALQNREVQLATLKAQLINNEGAINDLKTEIATQKAFSAEQQQELKGKAVQLATLQTQLEEEKRSSQEKVALLEKAEKNMSDAFENLSNKILKENSETFTKHNKESIGTILNPLHKQLDEFRKKVEDVYDKEAKDRTLLSGQINHLKSLNERISQDATNLTNALKGDSKKRGDWGEMILESVLENSGLRKGHEYEVQRSYENQEKNKSRLDVVVHLPNKRDVIIDSKLSLNAYERYYAATDEAEKQQALKQHLASIRQHITDLKSKNYTDLTELHSLDMVLMFVPIEPSLMLAFEHDEGLFTEAFKSGIFLVSPSTLTLNLQIIQNMWRHEYQNQNIQEIAKQASDMYDKLNGFIEALEDIDKHLGKAKESYDKAHNRLSSGQGNLITRAEKMRKLGDLKVKKALPESLVQQASEEDF